MLLFNYCKFFNQLIVYSIFGFFIIRKYYCNTADTIASYFVLLYLKIIKVIHIISDFYLFLINLLR